MAGQRQSSGREARKKDLFLVLMGLDGSGKSTQASNLKEFLDASGWRTVVIHHCTPLSESVRFVKGYFRERLLARLKHIGAHKEYTKAPEESSRRSGQFLGRLISLYIIFNGFLKSWYHFYRYKNEGFIYDRCFLDDMVKAYWRFGGGWGLGCFLLQYIPKPNRRSLMQGKRRSIVLLMNLLLRKKL
jgi:hypothetical protein